MFCRCFQAFYNQWKNVRRCVHAWTMAALFTQIPTGQRSVVSYQFTMSRFSRLIHGAPDENPNGAPLSPATYPPSIPQPSFSTPASRASNSIRGPDGDRDCPASDTTLSGHSAPELHCGPSTPAGLCGSLEDKLTPFAVDTHHTNGTTIL